MKLVFFAFSLLMFHHLFAQENGFINIIQDENIDFLMEEYRRQSLEKETEDGYRIQVVLSNTREEVSKAKTEFYKEFPDMKCYIVYDQPYYKLRVGDYKTRLEAKKMLLEIADIYPTAFIVIDEVHIRN